MSLNRQLCNRSDMAIAVFWSKIGTATQNALSGTIEEIQEHYKNKKLVFTYFREGPLPGDSDIEQIEKLREYKGEISKNTYWHTFKSPDNLKEVIVRDLRNAVKTLPYFVERAKRLSAGEHENPVPALGLEFNGIPNEIAVSKDDALSPGMVIELRDFEQDAKDILSGNIPKDLQSYIQERHLQKFRERIRDESALQDYLKDWEMSLLAENPIKIDCRVVNDGQVIADDIHIFVEAPEKVFFLTASDCRKLKKNFQGVINPLEIARREMDKRLYPTPAMSDTLLKNAIPAMAQFVPKTDSLLDLSAELSFDKNFYLSIDEGKISIHLEKLSQGMTRGFSKAIYLLPLERCDEEVKVSYICRQIPGEVEGQIAIHVS